MDSLFRISGVGSIALLLLASAGCGARAGFIEEYAQGGGGSGGAGGGGGSTTSSTTTSSSTTTTSSSTTTTTSTTMIGPGGTVISIAGDTMYEGETSVVATADGTVAAAWIAVSPFGEPFIAYAFSADDGASWQQPISLPSPDGRYGSDPVLAADSSGNIFMTWVGFHADMSGVTDMQVYVAASKPGSFAFGPPVLVSDPNEEMGVFLDKPWITVTPKNTVMVSYARFGNDSFSLISGRSVDFAQSFTRSVILSDDSFQDYYNLCYLCASKETGRLYATYLTIHQSGPLQIEANVSFSDDDGQSWPAGNVATASAGEPDVAFGDPSCTAINNDVFVSYGRSKDPLDAGSEAGQKDYSVVIRRSTSGGAQFDSMMDAADVMTAPFFMLPDLKHEDNGLLDIVYYAGVGDEDSNASFRRARFAFGPNNPPSEVVQSPVVMTPDRGVPYWLGDYIGHYVRGNQQYMTYVANSDFTSHVAFRKFQLQ